MNEDRIVKTIFIIRNGLSQIVEQLNDILNEYAPEQAIPRIDLAEIAELPWTSYKTKQPCTSPSEPGWIFNDPSRLSDEKQRHVCDELIRAIQGSKGKLQLGDMTFSFSGPKDDPKMFISRRPAKKTSNPHERTKQSIEHTLSS